MVLIEPANTAITGNSATHRPAHGALEFNELGVDRTQGLALLTVESAGDEQEQKAANDSESQNAQIWQIKVYQLHSHEVRLAWQAGSNPKASDTRASRGKPIRRHR